MGELFDGYLISDKYIDYLRKTEPRVMSNKAESRIYHRKYLGIIQELNGFKYFIPLSSPKPKDYSQNGKPKTDSFITIYMKDSRRLYGTLVTVKKSPLDQIFPRSNLDIPGQEL
jgi:hypothetical protein